MPELTVLNEQYSLTATLALEAWCIGNSKSWARVQVNLAEAVDHTKQMFGTLQRRAKVKTLSVGPEFR